MVKKKYELILSMLKNERLTYFNQVITVGLLVLKLMIGMMAVMIKVNKKTGLMINSMCRLRSLRAAGGNWDRRCFKQYQDSEDHEDGIDDKGGRVCDDYWHQVDHIECEYKEACEYRFFKR